MNLKVATLVRNKLGEEPHKNIHLRIEKEGLGVVGR